MYNHELKNYEKAGVLYPVYSLQNGMQQYYHSPGFTLKVNGKGTVLVEPDTAVITLGVITDNAQLEAAQKENTEKTSNVINSLIQLGIPEEDIQTQAYQIQPMYDYIDGKQVFRGYRVNHSLKVTVRNIAEAGKVIDTAVRAGANYVSSINFILSDPSAVYETALEAAIGDAQEKAAAIGIKLNVYVYPIPVRITEQTYQQITPVQHAFQQVAEAAVPLQPGQIEVIAQIEATFSYIGR
jgi:uncharacterized protein YggE